MQDEEVGRYGIGFLDEMYLVLYKQGIPVAVELADGVASVVLCRGVEAARLLQARVPGSTQIKANEPHGVRLLEKAKLGGNRFAVLHEDGTVNPCVGGLS